MYYGNGGARRIGAPARDGERSRWLRFSGSARDGSRLTGVARREIKIKDNVLTYYKGFERNRRDSSVAVARSERPSRLGALRLRLSASRRVQVSRAVSRSCVMTMGCERRARPPSVPFVAFTLQPSPCP